MSNRNLLLIVLFSSVAVGSRLIMIMAHPMVSYEQMQQKPGDEQYYMQLAHTMVADHEFREGFSRAYRPPGYPTFLAVHLLVFGNHPLPIQLTQNLLFLAAVAILTLTVHRTLGAIPAGLAAILLLTNPVWLIYPQDALSETLFIGLFSLGILLLLRLSANSSIIVPILIGITFALSALVREIGLYLSLAFIAASWYSLRSPRRPTRQVVIALAALALTILPWSIRNRLVLGKLIPITTNSTINLYMGNNPAATGRLNWTLPEGVTWNTSPADELNAYSRCGREAVRYILSHPIQTISLYPTKLRALWGPIPIIESDSTFDQLYRTLRYIHWPPFIALAAAGLWLMRRELLGRLILITVVIATAIHLLTYAGPNYRAPWELILCIPAAAALSRLVVLIASSARWPSITAALPSLPSRQQA